MGRMPSHSKCASNAAAENSRARIQSARLECPEIRRLMRALTTKLLRSHLCHFPLKKLTSSMSSIAFFPLPDDFLQVRRARCFLSSLRATDRQRERVGRVCVRVGKMTGNLLYSTLKQDRIWSTQP